MTVEEFWSSDIKLFHSDFKGITEELTMSARGPVFVLPVGTSLTASGNSLQLPGTSLDGFPNSDGIRVAAFDILAIDFTVVSGTITFFVDREGADGLWYSILTSGALGAGGVFSATLAGQNSASQEFGVTVRLRWTVSSAAVASASIVGK
jgi:hypothetical protein